MEEGMYSVLYNGLVLRKLNIFISIWLYRAMVCCIGMDFVFVNMFVITLKLNCGGLYWLFVTNLINWECVWKSLFVLCNMLTFQSLFLAKWLSTMWVKKLPHLWGFWQLLPNGWNFLLKFYTPIIYTKWGNLIQLPLTLTQSYHIKHDHRVTFHIVLERKREKFVISLQQHDRSLEGLACWCRVSLSAQLLKILLLNNPRQWPAAIVKVE